MTRIGIMQGRLLLPVNGKLQAFPEGRWEEEFPLAAEAGLECVEWIYDLASADTNPICSDAGIAHIQGLSSRFRVEIRSLCADYFVERPLIRAAEEARSYGQERLGWLLRRCQKLGIRRLVLPFVDQSAMSSPQDEIQVVECLKSFLPLVESLGLEIHLETSLAPQSFASFLKNLPHPFVKVNYDSGNSASLGYHPSDEFGAYGDRVGSVHIKDRRLSGGSVPLGEGDADFSSLFMGLKKLGYGGDFILQVARGAPGEEITWAKRNRSFVEAYWSTV